MNNRKAQTGNMVMVFTFIIVLLFIGIGLFLGVSIFFSSDYDFRQADADLLNTHLSNCIKQNQLNFNLEQEQFETELFEKCSLNKEATKENFIINIKKDGETIYTYKGDETACKLSDKNPEFSKCTTSSITLDQKTITILTGSNQKIRRKQG